MASLEQQINVHGEDYRLVLTDTPGNDWPWFVNAYEAEARGFIYPVKFLAGKTREDAIGRVTAWLEQNR
jgi:hypothetical protein